MNIDERTRCREQTVADGTTDKPPCPFCSEELLLTPHALWDNADGLGVPEWICQSCGRAYAKSDSDQIPKKIPRTDTFDPEAVQIAQAAEKCDFFAADLLLSCIHTRVSHDKISKGRTLVTIFILPLAVIVLIVAASHELTVPGGFHQISKDISNAFAGGTRSRNTLLAFPLLRDLPALIVITMAWLSPILTYLQWDLFEKAFPTYISRGLIRSIDSPEKKARGVFSKWFRTYRVRGLKHNDWPSVFLWTSDKIGAIYPLWSLLVAIVSFALCLLAIYSLSVNGIFQPIIGNVPTALGKATAPHAAYDQWWANWHHHPADAIALLISGTVLIYYSIMSNLIGYKTFAGMFFRPNVRMVFRWDDRNLDGHYGWDLARKLLFLTYGIFVLDGFVLVSLILIFAIPNNWLVLLLFSVFGALYVVSLFFYLTAPSLVFYRARRRAKYQRVTPLTAGLTSPSIEYRTYTQSQIDRIRDAPTYLLHFWQRVLFLFTGLAALAAIIGAILTLIPQHP